MKGITSGEVLIATLGTEPQVVTIVLDRLLALGRPVRAVRVVHTADPQVEQGLATLEAEFDRRVYPGVELAPVPVARPDGLVQDFLTDEDLTALMRTLYQEVREAKMQRQVVNLCISGGRKVMGIMGMVVAQLLFGPEDRVWHLVSEGWHPGGERRLHRGPDEPTWLVGVPVLRWSEAATLLRAVARLDDPQEVLRWQEKLAAAEEMRRRRDFVERWLTPAEREVVELACQGLDNPTIASRLYKREQTVANQLTQVYAKLEEWLDFPPFKPDRSMLIAEFAPYFMICTSLE